MSDRSVVHVAGEPEDGIQRCRWCGTVLADNISLIERNAVVAQTPGAGHEPWEPTWWPVGASVEMSRPRGSHASRVDVGPDCLPHEPRQGTTHWEDCWLEPGHHNCAVQRIYEIERAKDQQERGWAMGGETKRGSYRQLETYRRLRCMECSYEIDGNEKAKNMEAAVGRHLQMLGHRMIMTETYRYEVTAEHTEDREETDGQ